MVDTDKADVDVEIFENGVIDRILVPEGEKVPVGTPLATLESRPGAAPEQPATPVPHLEPIPQPTPPVPLSQPAPAAAGGATSSPVLRRLARHLAVDLGAVRGSGPGGAITRADIQAAAGSARATEVEQERVAPAVIGDGKDREGAMRDAIARLMARSKREIPHYYLGTDIDFSRSRAWLDDTNAQRSMTERLLPAVLLLKAVASATRAVPGMNGFWRDGYEESETVNVGVAISLRGGGLIAPAIRDADQKSLDELMHDLRDLVERTRAGRLRSSEMSGPTITVTNLGEQGVQTVHGVIYPPQVALVGFGRIIERPWAEEGMLGVRPVVSTTLAADHRASDGHAGARFLTQIDRLLQAPETL